jgi:hypothetical protein
MASVHDPRRAVKNVAPQSFVTLYFDQQEQIKKKK